MGVPFIRQSWIVLGVVLNQMGAGIVLSYSSSLLPALRASDSDIKVDLNSESWIASTVALSTIIGYIVSFTTMDKFGRKLSFAITSIPAIVGWIFIFYSKNMSMIIFGRFLGGVSAGASFSLGAIVIGEYTSPQNRGIFLNMKTTAICIGNMIMHILGMYYHWRTIALISILPFVLSFFNILTWTESPAWLFYTKKYENSKKSYQWLRGKSEQSMKEYEDFVQAQKQVLGTNNYHGLAFIIHLIKKIKEKDFLKPTIIIFTAAVLIESCGRHWYPAFALDILKSIIGDDAESKYITYSLIIDLIAILASSVSCIVIKIVKRRTLLFYCGISSVIILSGIIIYLYMVSWQILPNDKSWIPLLLFVVYFVLINIGCTNIALALLGELYPLKHRSFGSLVSGIAWAFPFFICLQSTPFFMHSFKIEGMLIINGVSFAGSLLFLYFMLPETSNKTLQDIEDYFKYGKFLDGANQNERDRMILSSRQK